MSGQAQLSLNGAKKIKICHEQNRFNQFPVQRSHTKRSVQRILFIQMSKWKGSVEI